MRWVDALTASDLGIPTSIVASTAMLPGPPRMTSRPAVGSLLGPLSMKYTVPVSSSTSTLPNDGTSRLPTMAPGGNCRASSVAGVLLSPSSHTT